MLNVNARKKAEWEQWEITRDAVRRMRSGFKGAGGSKADPQRQGSGVEGVSAWLYDSIRLLSLATIHSHPFFSLRFPHCKPNYISLIRTRDASSPPHCSPQSLLLFHLFLREAAFLPPPLHSLMTCFPHGNDFFFFCSHSLFITSWCRFFKKNPHILFSPTPTVQSPALWVGVWMTFRWPPLSRNPQFLSQPALHRSNPSTLHWNSSNLTASCKLTVLIRRWVQFMPPRRDTNRHTKPVLTSSFSNTQINDKLGAANKNEIIILTQTSHGEVCLEKVD